MTAVETAAPLVKDADLSLFGITHSEAPTVSRFPKSFNKSASGLWRKVLESDTYLLFKAKNSSTQALWTFCLREFLKRCAEEDVYAFSGSRDFEAQAQSYLKATRAKLVRFFSKHELFKKLRVQKVVRDYSFTDANFHISCTAYLKPIDDPTFEAWLLRMPEPSFKRHVEGLYKKSVHAHVDVEVEVTKAGATIRYSIFCHTPLRLLGPVLPTQRKMKDFADKKLWLPAIKAQPIPGLKNKFF